MTPLIPPAETTGSAHREGKRRFELSRAARVRASNRAQGESACEHAPL